MDDEYVSANTGRLLKVSWKYSDADRKQFQGHKLAIPHTRNVMYLRFDSLNGGPTGGRNTTMSWSCKLEGLVVIKDGGGKNILQQDNYIKCVMHLKSRCIGPEQGRCGLV
ncbi:hypothetical protein OGAPHI_006516 [Ogataea philodendri]|uniref:Uncharacterized protein n=1 Tax=Ogataea philodendri TaxID=1378263 RepID=A0A9P8T0P3_9ASCO|nr:uncharacterized protein OGAPHI_006516 [Ogataea philodendri]KAH3661666.1 hypothetical protein OGAPHI_006516 [Ogataea philodendri]